MERSIEKYKQVSKNLITEGWGNNPVCKAYNVNVIPHYTLIDKLGKTVNNNAQRDNEMNLEAEQIRLINY